VLSRWAWSRLTRRLEQRVNEFRPHAAIATQMGPAALLADIKRRRGLKLPLIAVPTDFGIHDFWLQRGIGAFCVAHESVTRPDLPPGSVLHATGLPLMPIFRHLPTRAVARAELGLHPERPMVLVAGGGLGLGVARLSARILAEVPDAAVVAVSGRNAEARAALEKLAPRYPDRLVDCGWTDHMPVWLRAADVVVGKPGGLTVAEALACGRCMLAIHSPGGQEGFNVHFLVEHGAGALVRDGELGERLRALCADPVQLEILQSRAAALGRRDGAAQIAALALDAARAAREAIMTGVPA
jgi:UDP-N-acetylglucosamine:LPS N-acetylglucosamine transferase